MLWAVAATARCQLQPGEKSKAASIAVNFNQLSQNLARVTKFPLASFQDIETFISTLKANRRRKDSESYNQKFYT